MRYLKILLTAIFILVLFSEDMSSQEPRHLVFRTGDAVYLRWSGMRTYGHEGYNVYRRYEAEEDWQKINPGMLSREYDLDEIRNIAGDYIGGLYLSLFGVKDRRDITAEDYEYLISTEDGFDMLNIMSVVYPAVGILLGEIYIDREYDENRKVQYSIKVVEDGEEKDWVQTTLFDPSIPDEVPAVDLPEHESRDQKIILKWEKDQELFDKGTVVTYNIYRAEDITGPYMLVNPQGYLAVSSGDENEDKKLDFLDDFLENGKKYYYYIKAVNSFGFESIRSPIIEAVPQEHRKPPTPGNIRFEMFGGELKINWEYSSSIAAKGFMIFKSENDSADFSRIYPPSDMLLSSDIIMHIDTDIKQGNRYFYYMKTVNESGIESESTDTLSFFIPDETPPAPPANVNAIADTGRITIKWSPNKEEDLLGYEVERSSDPTHESRFFLTYGQIKDTSFVDTLRKESRAEYGYVVYAVDESYNRSGPSEMVYAKMPDILAPLPPMITRLRKEADKIYIRWTPSEAEDLMSYRIYLSYGDTTNFIKVKEIDDIFTKLEYEESGDHFFRVTAVDINLNESDPSAIKKLTIKPEMPQSPENGRILVNENNLVIEWDASPSKNATGYFIQRRDVEDNITADMAYLKKNETMYINWNFEKEKEYEFLVFTHDKNWRLSEPLIIRYIPDEGQKK